MTSKKEPQIASRERTALLLFISSIVCVGLSLVYDLTADASWPMIAISGISLLFAILPILAIIRIRSPDPYFNDHSNYGFKSVRTNGILFGVLLIFFIMLGVLASDEVYGPDIPGGILILIAGFLALAGSAIYPVIRVLPPTTPSLTPTYTPTVTQTQGTIPHAHEKEVIREKEVIVKMRCQYCGNTFDETLDQCPVCGARK